jgi:hypothetical protein
LLLLLLLFVVAMTTGPPPRAHVYVISDFFKKDSAFCFKRKC